MLGDEPADVKAGRNAQAGGDRFQQINSPVGGDGRQRTGCPREDLVRTLAAYLNAMRQAFLKAGQGLSGYRRYIP
jgi:hypothetical protein